MTDVTHKYDRHFNDLSPAEDERLTLLYEECSEVIKAIAKIQRHGYASYHPDTGVNNRDALAHEMGDVLMAMQLLCDAGDIREKIVLHAAGRNVATVKPYLHHQPEDLI